MKPKNTTVMLVYRLMSGFTLLAAMFWLWMSGLRLEYIMAIECGAMSFLFAIWALQPVGVAVEPEQESSPTQHRQR